MDGDVRDIAKYCGNLAQSLAIEAQGENLTIASIKGAGEIYDNGRQVSIMGNAGQVAGHGVTAEDLEQVSLTVRGPGGDVGMLGFGTEDLGHAGPGGVVDQMPQALALGCKGLKSGGIVDALEQVAPGALRHVVKVIFGKSVPVKGGLFEAAVIAVVAHRPANLDLGIFVAGVAHPPIKGGDVVGVVLCTDSGTHGAMADYGPGGLEAHAPVDGRGLAVVASGGVVADGVGGVHHGGEVDVGSSLFHGEFPFCPLGCRLWSVAAVASGIIRIDHSLIIVKGRIRPQSNMPTIIKAHSTLHKKR